MSNLVVPDSRVILVVGSPFIQSVLVVGSPFIRNIEQKLGGALAVKVQTTDTCGEMEGECITCIAAAVKQKADM